MTSRYVGFATGSGPYHQYLYDIRARKLLTIGHGSLGGDMPGNGAYLTWSSYPTPQSTADTHVVQLLN